MNDHFDELAVKILAVIRSELVHHFITRKGSQAEMLRAIANVLREHRSTSHSQRRTRDHDEDHDDNEEAASPPT